MGVLTDDPTRSRPLGGRGGHGGKFLRIWRGLDDEDRAKIRAWCDDDQGEPIFGGIMHTWREVSKHFEIGYTAVENGIWRLREAGWEA